jgi:hypothetical protein
VEARAPVLPGARREASAHALGAEARSDTTSSSRRRPHRVQGDRAHVAYHGTTFGALSINGIPALRTPFEPLVPRCATSRTPNRYHRPPRRPRRSSRRCCSTISRRRSSRWGRRTVCWCTWSPCRTPAARSRRPRATGAASASSATATTSCSPPTR